MDCGEKVQEKAMMIAPETAKESILEAVFGTIGDHREETSHCLLPIVLLWHTLATLLKQHDRQELSQARSTALQSNNAAVIVDSIQTSETSWKGNQRRREPTCRCLLQTTHTRYMWAWYKAFTCQVIFLNWITCNVQWCFAKKHMICLVYFSTSFAEPGDPFR